MDYSLQSLGKYLKEQREIKGLSIEEAAVETNIARKYIEALEKDEYGFFPAEMYVLGFLSSYIEVLELDKDYVFAIYHRSIDREREVPLEQLYDLHSSSNFFKDNIKWFVVGISFLLLVSIISLIVSKSKNSNYISSKVEKVIDSNDIIVDIATLNVDNEMKIGLQDKVQLVDNGNVRRIIEFLGHGSANNQIRFRLGQNEYMYKSGDILSVDLSGTGLDNLGLEIIDIDNDSLVISFLIQQINNPNRFDINQYKDEIRNEIPIAVVDNVESFNMTILTERPVWVGYQIDIANEQQQVLNPGQNISFTFKDGVRVLLGNAGAVTISFEELTNIIRGGTTGESSQSIFYTKQKGQTTTLYRAQLR